MIQFDILRTRQDALILVILNLLQLKASPKQLHFNVWMLECF